MLDSNYFEDETFSPDNPIDLNSLKGSEFISCTFKGLYLINADCSNSKFLECSFTSCNMSNTILKNSALRDVSFKDTKQIGINFSDCSNISAVEFESCLLDLSVWQALKIVQLKFHNCSLKDVDFSDSSLPSLIMTKCNLSGSIFSGCDLTKADFRESINYSIDSRDTILKHASFSMPEAISLLTSLEILVD